MLSRLFRRRSAPAADAALIHARRADRVFAHLDDAQWHRLTARAALFLRDKSICGAGGFEPDETARWTIALQAALPALNLGFEPYADFVDVIVYPDTFIVPRRVEDDDGVVHEFDDELAGEAIDGGPVVLSWPDVASDEDDAAGYSVVIHEFLHKIDLCDGDADGVPPLARSRRAEWADTLGHALTTFRRALDRVERSIPRTVDPQTQAALPYYASLPMDPYAATDPAEFFAVSGEVFFTDPATLAMHFPALYAQYRRYFGQDPATRAVDRPSAQANR